MIESTVHPYGVQAPVTGAAVAASDSLIGLIPVSGVAPTPAPADISIIVPTFNERGNVRELVRRISDAMEGVRWEVIVVDDDSPDGTAAEARELYTTDARIRCIRRLGRRGLSSACIEGILSSSAPFVAVIDADLQHNPTLLRDMFDTLRSNEADLVIGSRYAAGGSVGEWDRQRLAMSRFATTLALVITKVPVSDAMSGFFAVRRDLLEESARDLSSLGFKILLDFLASTRRDLRIKELPYTFGQRLSGTSKLSANVMWEFLLLLADKLVGRYVPVRFLAFAGIGAIGIGVHFAVLTLLFKGVGIRFEVSQATATAVAILFNFSVNNVLTYAGQSLKGAHWFRGLFSFYLICGVGALANIGVASYLFGQQTYWPLAALAGIAMSVVWNYAVSARYTWKTAS